MKTFSIHKSIVIHLAFIGAASSPAMGTAVCCSHLAPGTF